MKDYFVEYLNEWLVEVGCPVVQQTKIHRFTSYTEDYGALSADQRMELIGGDQFHIDGEFLKGKLVLLMDDIRITGAHENMVTDALSLAIVKTSGAKRPKEIPDNWCTPWFLYYAVLSNDQICPTIENDLNYAAIKDVWSINDLMVREDFAFNTRMIKYLLKAPWKEFSRMIVCYLDLDIGPGRAEALYHLAIGNSYHLVPEYQENLDYLKTLLHE